MLDKAGGNGFSHWSQSSGIGSLSMLTLGSSFLHIPIPLDHFLWFLTGPHTYTGPKYPPSAVREGTMIVKMSNNLMTEAASCTVAVYPDYEMIVFQDAFRPATWKPLLVLLLLVGCDITEQLHGNGRIVSSASIRQETWDTNMQRFANPLLRHVIRRGCFDAASKRQCLQYLRALRTLQLNGFNTVFLGETDIPESLITGEKLAEETSLRWPVWTLVHAGSHQGWVPWKYKLLLRGDLPIHQQSGIFQELCESLTTSYGKCVIVMKDKMQPMNAGAKDSKEPEPRTPPPVLPVIHMTSTKHYLEAARANGHELLVVPSSYNYLYPMDVAWSSLKSFIINNRKDFALRSIERTHSYRCILFRDLIVKGIEKMTPSKWKAVINRVKRWENYYLDTLS